MPPSKRKSWNPSAMIKAVNAVRSKQMGYLKASKEFSVPRGTLEHYVKKEAEPSKLVKTRMGRHPILPENLEADLTNYCKEMDKRFYGLRLTDIKHMAFQLAISNNLKHPFNVSKESAGKKWLRPFLHRHPELSVRTPQATSAARIKGFNPETVNSFFDIYEPEMKKIKYSPYRVYNVDETGITVVQHKQSKIISVKGKKQVGTLTSLERGKLITVVTCMNACGNFVPPMIIFPRKNLAQDLMDGAPPGSIAGCHPSGWIQSHLFTRWFQHFIKFTKPSEEDSIVLVLDGHYTHTRNIDMIEMARENHVTVVCLPPHCTHRMQPMDIGFMKPLKTYYAHEIETWLRNNPGRTLSNKYVCKLFGAAYEKAATMSNSVNSFRKTGLFPCNRHIFTEDDFSIFNDQRDEDLIANDQLERHQRDEQLIDNGQLEERQGNKQLTEQEQPETRNDISIYGTVPVEVVSAVPKPNETQEMRARGDTEVAGTSKGAMNELRFVSSFTIKPVPRIQRNESTRRTRSRSAAVITSSPYKQTLLESTEKKKEKENKKAKKQTTAVKGKKLMNKKRKGVIKRKRQIQSDSSDLDEEPILADSSSEDESNDAECPYCGGRFSQDKKGEKWAKCQACFKWAHEDCGEPFTGNTFLCSLCLNN